MRLFAIVVITLALCAVPAIAAGDDTGADFSKSVAARAVAMDAPSFPAMLSGRNSAGPLAPAETLKPAGILIPAATLKYEERANSRAREAWKLSLAPLIASQSLDAASSYGLRELNPLLAGPDGRFGARAAVLKIGVVGAVIASEMLLVRKFPRSARIFSTLNWTTGAITTGLAAHNFTLR